ncbi:hypothetical protein [Desulfitobacterium sp. PCE1]|uniref:hypothetical protein n=1 Tax=Desulfitobacterium sp. PCE1 TaxID=146907 RepID=UPI000369C5F3|nr:hypothetical protein [Desulfitobacterium sp. PCE1]
MQEHLQLLSSLHEMYDEGGGSPALLTDSLEKIVALIIPSHPCPRRRSASCWTTLRIIVKREAMSIDKMWGVMRDKAFPERIEL